jgi:hypothetical protein
VYPHLIISLGYTDRCGNRHTLDVRGNEFGSINYDCGIHAISKSFDESALPRSLAQAVAMADTRYGDGDYSRPEQRNAAVMRLVIDAMKYDRKRIQNAWIEPVPAEAPDAATVFLRSVARMKTEEEYESEGGQMDSEDAFATVNQIITEARQLVATAARAR